MKLKAVILENFRSYGQRTRIEIEGGLTALIGKNDVGKSTVLDALEIFFNSETVKMGADDACVFGNSKTVRIGCVFTDLPKSLVLDTTAPTSLEDECLLNADGDLEIYKIFDCSLKNPKASVVAEAMHPTADGVKDLLLLKQPTLRERLGMLGIDRPGINHSSNPAMRKAIRESRGDLRIEKSVVDLEKEEGKRIWEVLRKELPVFALFRADRPSTDQDSEVQDPMKIAVAEAIRTVEDQLHGIEDAVRKQATEVAVRTLEKLKEMDATVASGLLPEFRADPKWDSLFKLTLTGDDGVSVNKRGSGVRRLILLNFFRAEAERRQLANASPSVLYAIEEPETSQHPNNQKMLVQSLLDLCESGDCQVILTTHVPGLAGLLPVESLRYVEKEEQGINKVSSGTDDVYRTIAEQLGVLPDSRVQILFYVEGPHDIDFLNNISTVLHQVHPDIPNLLSDPRVAVIPVGGSTLCQWVRRNYLGHLNLPEIHVYDRDVGTPPKYQSSVDAVNQRGCSSWATLTCKRELENYLHPDAIQEGLGLSVTFDDHDDVPRLIADASKVQSCLRGQMNEKRAKRLLNEIVTQKMTPDRLAERDPEQEVVSWLRRVGSFLT